jgi:excisionase family DNA binding protein
MDIVLIKKKDLEEIIRDAALRGAEVAIRKMPKKHPRQYTISEAAEEIGVSRPMIYKMIKAGEIKLNSCGRISDTDIDRLIASRPDASPGPRRRAGNKSSPSSGPSSP